MKVFLTILLLATAVLAQETKPRTDFCVNRAKEIVERLEPHNFLRRAVEEGEYGDCVQRDWMDKMLQLHIKQANVWVEYSWKKNNLTFKIKGIGYLENYFQGPEVVKGVRESGLDAELRKFVLGHVQANWGVKRENGNVSRDQFNVHIFADKSLPIFYSIF